MKKYINTIIGKGLACVLLFSVMTGCDDFLDITPPSEIAPESFLWSDTELATYIVTYYLPGNNDGQSNYGGDNDQYGGRLPSHWGSGGESFYNDDVATDNATTKSSNSRYIPGNWTVGNTGGAWNFRNIYALNYYLNTVVPRYEAGEISGVESSVRHYIGEGYFLRAHEYFYRLRKLGDFPIVTEVLADDQAVLTEASKRRPRNEVARFILSDLDEAISMLNNSPSGGKVRITKNAALLLKARVALFEGTWLKYHAGTAHVPNGTGWPGAAKDYNAGYSFPAGSLDGEIDYFLSQAMDAAAQVADAISLTTNTFEKSNDVISQGELNNNNGYYKMFATSDPSGYGEVLMYRQYATSLSSHCFNHYLYSGAAKGYTNQMEKAFLMENGLPHYSSNSQYEGDDTVEDTKVNRDWRWRLFMKAPNEVKAVTNIGGYEYFENAPLIHQSDGKTSTATGYLIGKGYNYDYNMQLLNQDLTAPVIFRAAEAYLAYIEACYVKNGTIDSKADQYWKAIRTRAGVDPDYSKTIAATDMSIEAKYDWGAYSQGQLVDATLYNIRRERRCELIGEGQRYNDLIRWRAMDQLNGFQIEGMKLWGSMQYRYADGELIADRGDTENTVSSPGQSDYLRPYQIASGNTYYNGLFFASAHYLDPIAIQHFLITAEDGQTISTSPIYQNPDWPTEAAMGAIK